MSDHHTRRTEWNCIAVVMAVAEREGVEPTDLSPLADAVDPDAFATLAATAGVEVRFTYEGYEIAVGRAGEVRVEPRDG